MKSSDMMKYRVWRGEGKAIQMKDRFGSGHDHVLVTS